MYIVPRNQYSDISVGVRGGAWAIRSSDDRVVFNSDVTGNPNGWVAVPDDLDVGTIRKVLSGFYSVLAVNTDRRVFVRAGLGDKKNPGGSSWRLLIDEAVDLAECKLIFIIYFHVNDMIIISDKMSECFCRIFRLK